MNVRISIKGVEKVKQFMIAAPKYLNDIVTKTIAEYLLGEPGEAGDAGSTSLRGYSAYKFARRDKAYGKVSDAPAGYFSWKQFRYVAWKTEGFTTNMGSAQYRTGASGRAWQMSKIPTGYQLYNASPGMVWARKPGTQARQLVNAGWRDVFRVMGDRIRKAAGLALVEVNKALGRIPR